MIQVIDSREGAMGVFQMWRILMRLVALFAILCIGSPLSIACLSCDAQEAKQKSEWEARVEAVRHLYAMASPEILGLVEPIQIKMSTVYFDGGTFEVTLVDKQAKELRFKLRPYAKGLTEKIQEYEYCKYLLGSFSIQSQKGDGESWQTYPVRSPEESAVYGLLIRWEESREGGRIGDLDNEFSLPEFLNAIDLRFAYREQSVPNKRYYDSTDFVDDLDKADKE